MSALARARVTLRFDDGFDDLFSGAKPILDAAGLPATAMIITSWINTPGKVTAAQLQAAQAAGWDIGSHTRNNVILTTVDEATQWAELTNSKSDLGALGITVRSFAPPSNGWSAALQSMAAAAGYESASTGYRSSPPYSESWPVANAFDLKRSPSISSQAHSAAMVLGWVDAAIAAKAWQILLFHNVRDVNDAYSTSPAMFGDIVNGLTARISAGTLDVVTQHQGLQQPPPPDPGTPVEPLAAKLGQLVLRGRRANHVLARASIGELSSEYDLSAFRAPFGAQAHKIGTGHQLPPVAVIRGVIERDDFEDATAALDAFLADLAFVDRLSVGVWLVDVLGAAGAVTCSPTLRGWAVTAQVHLDPAQPWREA